MQAFTGAFVLVMIRRSGEIAAAPSLKAHESALLMAHILPRTDTVRASTALRLAA